MRVNSVSNYRIANNFKANPTGIAKNSKKIIRKMGLWGGASIGIGTIGALSILSGASLVGGFACLIPTFYCAKRFDKEAQGFQNLARPYKEIKQRAKKIYG